MELLADKIVYYKEANLTGYRRYYYKNRECLSPAKLTFLRNRLYNTDLCGCPTYKAIESCYTIEEFIDYVNNN